MSNSGQSYKKSYLENNILSKNGEKAKFLVMFGDHFRPLPNAKHY
mgnify:CR=1 FL=1